MNNYDYRLLRVLEQLLIEVEPLLSTRRQDIDRLVEEKQVLAEKYNRVCSNSNEMWFYSQEYRRALEKDIEPLTEIVKEANIIFDEIVKNNNETYIEDY